MRMKVCSFLTFLHLLQRLITSTQEGENDSSLRIQTHGTDQHSARSLHHMSSWKKAEGTVVIRDVHFNRLTVNRPIRILTD